MKFLNIVVKSIAFVQKALWSIPTGDTFDLEIVQGWWFDS
jgi:hypothetical protein